MAKEKEKPKVSDVSVKVSPVKIEKPKGYVRSELESMKPEEVKKIASKFKISENNQEIVREVLKLQHIVKEE